MKVRVEVLEGLKVEVSGFGLRMGLNPNLPRKGS